MSRRRVLLLGLPTLLCVWVALGGASHSSLEPQALTEAPAPLVTDGTTALDLLERAGQKCEAIAGYRCVLATRERVRGQLQPEQVMELVLVERPFSVHLRWLAPSTSVGQEVRYIAGANDDRMIVRPAGYLGALTGTIRLDPDAPSVRENSRHTIRDAGFARMLARFRGDALASSLAVTESEVAGRPCQRIDSIADGQRSRLHLDVATGLPVRIEIYDRDGRSMDEATYRAVTLNY